MGRARNPERDKAYQLWIDSGEAKPLKDIAAELGVSDTLVRKWKNIDKWDGEVNGNVTKKGAVTKSNGNVTKNAYRRKKRTAKKLAYEVDSNPELDEKEKLFCIHYYSNYNASAAYQKAYG